jgi:hypothetical protein
VSGRQLRESELQLFRKIASSATPMTATPLRDNRRSPIKPGLPEIPVVPGPAGAAMDAAPQRAVPLPRAPSYRCIPTIRGSKTPDTWVLSDKLWENAPIYAGIKGKLTPVLWYRPLSPVVVAPGSRIRPLFFATFAL